MLIFVLRRELLVGVIPISKLGLHICSLTVSTCIEAVEVVVIQAFWLAPFLKLCITLRECPTDVFGNCVTYAAKSWLVVLVDELCIVLAKDLFLLIIDTIRV